MDLGSSYLYVKVKLVKQDGTNLEEPDMYGHTAGIPVLLTNGRGWKKCELTSILYYKGTTPNEFYPTKNTGFKAQQQWTALLNSSANELLQIWTH